MKGKKNNSGQNTRLWKTYIESKKYKEALDLCEATLNLHPSNTKEWFRKGYTFILLNKYDSAVTAFNAALKLKPNYAVALKAKAYALMMINRDSEALDAVNKAIEINPNDNEAWISKGRLLGYLGRYDESIEAFDKLLEIEPNDTHALVHKGETLQIMGKSDNALKIFNNALKIEPNDAYLLACKAETLQAMERYDDSLKAFNEALKIEPDFVDVLFRKALLLIRLKSYQAASKALDAALILKPDYTDAWYEKSSVLLHEKRFDETITASDEVLKLNPNNVNAWANKGTALLNLRRLNDALDAFDHAIQLAPDFIDAWGRKAGILALMERYDEALDACTKTLKLKPDLGPILQLKTMIFLNLNRFDDALRSANVNIKLNPGDGHALLFKASILLKINKLPEALKCVNESEGLFRIAQDLEAEQSARSLITSLNNRIQEKSSKTKPSIETEIIRNISTLFTKKGKEDPFFSISKRERDNSEYFNKKRTIQQDDAFFVVLRRWNSFTPSIPKKIRTGKGGGYFLVWKGKGVVIDPGFDFLENFDDAGFSIDDIDAIVLTHAHTDHTADLERLLCLKHELWEHQQEKDFSKIDLFMNLGSIHKFIGWISMLKITGKVITLNAGDLIEPQGYSWSLRATHAEHSEVIGKNCIGLVFNLRENSKEVLQLGITGDTAWSKNIEDQYKGCRLLCVHLGSIQSSELDEKLPLKSKKRMYQGQHLGLIGTLRVIESNRPQLSIISEFGEELGNDRCHIATSIDKAYGKTIRCLTGDIGLKIRLPDLNVYCSICNDYRKYTSIQECDIKDSIVYHCDTHTAKDFVHKFIV